MDYLEYHKPKCYGQALKSKGQVYKSDYVFELKPLGLRLTIKVLLDFV